jgi:hypothetical protein
MIGKFIGVLFLSRDVAHREHLKTKSYSQHVALGAFYDEITDLADSLTEAYQGRHGIIDDIPIFNEVSGSTKTTAADKIQEILDFIEKERYDAIKKEDTPLQNIVDEIVGLFLSTLYKLNNLK